MISQETIQGLVEALDTLSDATNVIVHGGSSIPIEIYGLEKAITFEG